MSLTFHIGADTILAVVWVYLVVRKSWGDLKPITKRIESNKRYCRKNKWGNRYSED